ncbi:uncharacterized protein LOC113474990 [Ciona intestinalis]
MQCLPKPPDFVYATVRPSNQSLPHKFSAAILEIKAYSFVFEIERVDQATGWDTMITVDWFFYIGIAFAHRERIYWLPELSGIKTMTKEQSAIYCSNRSAELADIADKETYGLISDHVVRHYEYQALVYTYVHVWIASKYNPQTGNVTQSNGEPGFNGDGNWKQPGFPTSQSTSTELVIRVRYLLINDSGLLNYPIGKEFEASTVLCSMKLPPNP